MIPAASTSDHRTCSSMMNGCAAIAPPARRKLRGTGSAGQSGSSLCYKVLDAHLRSPYPSFVPRLDAAARTTAPPPAALSDRAMDNLRFIRETMERAGAFTAIPGRATMFVGLTAVAATALAHLQPSFGRWLTVWLGEAVLGVAVGGWALSRKAKAAGAPLSTGPGRR